MQRIMEIFKFIEESGISRREIERELGMPEKSFKGEPKKWKVKIEDYCFKNHGWYPDGYDDLGFHEPQRIKSIDSEGRKRWYGGGRIPGFTDGVLRFRDPETGLWRKYDEHAYSKGLLKKGWELDGEVFEDKVGGYQKIGYRDLLIYSSFKGDESYLKGEMAKIYK